MALRIILGRAGTGKTEYCLREIRRELDAAADGAPLLLLLPEHATFKAERELSGAASAGGFARAAAFGFKRLAQRVLLETGGALRPRLQEVGKRLLLSGVLTARAAELTALRRAARQRNFADSLAVMIEEFKSYRVAPEQLAQAAAELADSPLGEKLADLSLLYGAFAEAMQGRYSDAEDSLAELAERTAESALLRDAQVWVDGFTFFNPQETAVLGRLLQTARTVTVTLAIDGAVAAEHERETALFHRQWKTLGALRRLAAELAIPVEELTCGESRRFARADLAHLEANLYRFPARLLRGGAPRGTRIVEAANRRLEAEAAAADILRLCREEGFRWRDIGVLTRDAESYAALLEEVFADYAIPFFSDAQRRSVHHPLAELLRSALEAIGGWRYEPLFRCFKTDFFPATRDEVDLLENYVLEFGIRGKRWTMEEDWTYQKRLSLEEDDAAADGAAERLARINAVRRALIAPLAAFARRFQAAEDAAAMTEALYALLAELEAPRRLEEWAAEDERRGDLAAAGEHRQLWDNIVLLLDQLAETCGAAQLTPDEYEALLGDGLESLTLRLIPPGLDHVTIAAFDQNSLDNLRAVYILGVNEGVVPRRSRSEGLLTDAERERMARLGLGLSPGAGADNFAERFAVYSALTRPSEYLWLSYPLADDEGGALSPSPLLAQLREMLGITTVDSILLANLADGERWRIARPRRAVSHLAEALQEARQGRALPEIWRDVYNWALGDAAARAALRGCLAGLLRRDRARALPPQLARRLYAQQRLLRGSVTRFERFRACPFRHFAQYGLKLKERAEHRFAAPDLGQFLHAALKSFGDRMRDAGRNWGDVDEAERRALCGAIVDDLAPRLQNEILLSSAQYRHLLVRIRRTVERSVQRLIAFDRVSAFKPTALEQSFGRGRGALPPLSYSLGDGYRLEIEGQIDRIDAWAEGEQRYFLVMDYKSGGAYLNLIEVYYGLRLQLLTYLLVAANAAAALLGRPALPAGALYCFLKNPALTETRRLTEKEALEKVDALLKMPGWVLADVDMARRIDSSFKFIKVAVTAKNAFHAASQNSVKTEEEFAALLGYVGFMLADTGRRILDGDIDAAPYELGDSRPCAYCAYRSFCRFDPLLPEDAYRRLEKPDDATILDEMARRGEAPNRAERGDCSWR